MGEWLRSRRSHLLLTLILCVGFATAYYFATNRAAPRPILIVTPTTRPTAPPPPSPTPITLVVQVNGAVAKPGLVRLPDGARVDDAIKATGGFSTDADAARINLAKRLNDGELIVVPRIGEPLPTAPPSTQRATITPTPTAAPLNINTASLEELDRLPGIGPTTARAIIEYRQANGPFQKPEDLMKVRGIGPALFDDVKHLILVK